MSHEVMTLNKRSFKKTQKSKPELCGTSHFRGKQRKGKGGRRKMKGKASAWRRERLVGGATKNTKSISTLKSIYCETSKSTTLDLAIRRSLVVFTKGGPWKVGDLATSLKHKTAESEAHIPSPTWARMRFVGLPKPWTTHSRIIWRTCLKLLLQGPYFRHLNQNLQRQKFKARYP